MDFRDVLLKHKIPPNSEALDDVLYDYELQAEQLQKLLRRQRDGVRVILSGGESRCGGCRAKVYTGAHYCWRCGAGLKWDVEQRRR